MTVSTETAEISYATNGSTTVFAVPFYFLEDSHLAVSYVDSNDVLTLLTLTTDYTVTGAGNPAGGSITTLATYPGSGSITIESDVPATQETDYIAGDAFPSEAHEQALDKLTMIARGLKARISRALRVRSGETLDELPSASERANKFFAFDADGNASVASGTTVNGTPFTPLADTLVSRATADLMRGDLVAAESGANTDITSLDNPTVIENQSQTSVGSTIATNYWVDRRGWGTGARQSVTFSNNLDDATGAPSWGGSTGSTSLSATISGTFSCASANGRDVNNLLIGSTTWTGLSAVSTTYYLYVDVTGSELTTTTTGSTTLAPSYTEGDVYSTTNGQHTFCIPDMQMRVGDGSTATQVYRLFVGEATTNGAGVVGSFKWYGIRGRTIGITASWASSSFVTLNHNLGYPGEQITVEVFIAPTSAAQHGYQPLTAANPDWVNISSNRDITISNFGRLQSVISTSNSINIVPSGGGAPVAITPANWTLRAVAKRNW